MKSSTRRLGIQTHGKPTARTVWMVPVALLLVSPIVVNTVFSEKVGPPIQAETTTMASATPVRMDESWASVLQNLDRKRMKALETRDVSLLEDIYVKNSAPYDSDLAVVQSLIADNLIADAPTTTVVSVAELFRRFEGSSVVASLLVVDSLSDYTITGGDTVTVPGRGEKTWVMVMRKQSSTSPWRLESITERVQTQALVR